MFRQRRLYWLGHVRRMKEGRIRKDIMYGKLIAGMHNLGSLRFTLLEYVQAGHERAE